MASATQAAGYSAEVTRVFAAPRERLWQAWTQADQLIRWLCRTDPETTVRVLQLDLRAGGNMVLEAQGKGPLHHLDCVFQEVQPMERLSFTWKWQADEEQSLVTVEFFEQSGGTRVRLVHSKFATEKSRDGHAWGWNACFDTLDLALKN